MRKIFHSLILFVKWLKWKVLFIQKKFCYSKMDIHYLTIFILQFTNEQFVKVTISSFDEADPSSTFCGRLLVFIFFTTVLSTYRSQTAVLFQRPCCFNSSKPIPFLLSIVADVCIFIVTSPPFLVHSCTLHFYNLHFIRFFANVAWRRSHARWTDNSLCASSYIAARQVISNQWTALICNTRDTTFQ